MRSTNSPALGLLLAALLAAFLINRAQAQAAKEPETVDWIRLRGLNYKTGKINADAKALDKARIRILGYMVPFEDEDKEVTEFLLVPNMACIHVPAPPQNQIILVQMAGGKKAPAALGKTFWVEGLMAIETSKSAYAVASYRLSATKVQLAKEE